MLDFDEKVGRVIDLEKLMTKRDQWSDHNVDGLVAGIIAMVSCVLAVVGLYVVFQARAPIGDEVLSPIDLLLPFTVWLLVQGFVTGAAVWSSKRFRSVGYGIMIGSVLAGLVVLVLFLGALALIGS